MLHMQAKSSFSVKTVINACKNIQCIHMQSIVLLRTLTDTILHCKMSNKNNSHVHQLTVQLPSLILVCLFFQVLFQGSKLAWLALDQGDTLFLQSSVMN